MSRSEGFDEFYQATYGRLVGQLYPITGSLPEAEEVVQEAFVRALARWSRVRNYDLPEVWVRRVALNLATNELRRARSRLAALARLRPDTEDPPMSEEAAVLGLLQARLAREQRRRPLGGFEERQQLLRLDPDSGRGPRHLGAAELAQLELRR